MDPKPFADPALQPTAETLSLALGPASGCYEQLLAATPGYVQAWNYSKGSGWMLKIHDGRKALLYVIPLRESFRASMAIREPEREALLADDRLAAVHAVLAAARRAPEGFACFFDVGSASELAPVEQLVRRLVELRSS